MKNITYSHEHMVIDLSKGKDNEDCYLNAYDEALDELKYIHSLGVERIVDCSNHGIGVDWATSKMIEQKTGLKIVRSTGFYKDPFLPNYVKDASIEELENIILDDLKNGALVIGEIGTSNNEITSNERKIFMAACAAQKKTNAVIITHTTLGTKAEEQVAIFKENNIDLHKVIISHTALANDYALLVRLCKSGVNIAFDTIGKIKYLPDETRADFITQLIKEGYTKQLLMSMDLTRQSHLKKNGGCGYAYLIETFVPMLINKGVKEEDIEQIMCKNFSQILEG